MEIEYKGGNCVVISTKKSALLVDPKIEALDNKEVVVKGAVQIATKPALASQSATELCFEGPGEYEVANISIRGIATKLHTASDKTKDNTIYSIDTEDIRVGVLGHVSADLSEEQLEQLGTIDVLIVPVGGYGYTLEPHEAVALVRRISPKVVIPTHYADDKIEYTIAQGELAPFLKEMSAPHETIAKYKLKSTTLPEVLTVVVIEKS